MNTSVTFTVNGESTYIGISGIRPSIISELIAYIISCARSKAKEGIIIFPFLFMAFLIISSRTFSASSISPCNLSP